MDKEIKTSPRAATIRRYFKSGSFWKPFLSIIIGGVAGYLFFYFIGCKTGACAITSNPYGSIFMGSLLGYFFTSSPCISCDTENNK
jgi:uncharacterized membrane protein HdeD (DUF308 family)